jgi:TATA-box binding protein (TBP) (component of TFIID and TFIIIB)
MSLECKNVKITLYLKNDIDAVKLLRYSSHNTEKRNCFIIRSGSFVLTMYKHSIKTLHVTGIKSKNEFIVVLKYVKFVLEDEVIRCKLDNSMFSCKLKKSVNLKLLIKEICQNYSNIYTCNFTQEIFPALFIKPNKEHKKEGFPTVLVFSNGSFVIMGGKNLNRVKFVDRMVREFIEQNA